MIVYFDTNVFDHLQQLNGVNEWDVYRLKRAVKQGHLRIVLSFLNIEEILFISQSKPERARAQLELIFELTDRQLFVIGQDEIMNNAIQAYADDTESISTFTNLNLDMEVDIRNLMNCTGIYRQDWDEIIQETRAAKETFMKSLREGKAELKPMADKIGGVRQYPFVQYLANNSGWMVRSLADGPGVLSKVSLRGIDGLLKIKSIALAVGANLSLLYSHHFENRAPRSGDSRDMLHVVLASPADVFVTDDGSLEAILSRIPVDGFKVMSLPSFMQSLPQWI